MTRFTEKDAQLAIARLFNHWGPNKAIPNTSCLGWEMDMAIITPSNYLYEIEIKRSQSDWRADEKKEKWGMDRQYVSRFYYAIPEGAEDKIPSFVSESTGIILIKEQSDLASSLKLSAEIYRKAKRIGKTRLPQERCDYFIRCFYGKYWGLRQKLGYKDHQTFLAFIRKNQYTDNRIGDYCYDTLRKIKENGVIPKTKEQYYRMVEGGNESVIEAFNEAWEAYANG